MDLLGEQENRDAEIETELEEDPHLTIHHLREEEAFRCCLG